MPRSAAPREEGPVGRVSQAQEGAGASGQGVGSAEWQEAGKRREGWDTRCRCEKPLPQLVWIGYEEPLERWCFLCGRVLPRPFDRKFLAVVGRDAARRAAAELVGAVA